MLKTAGQDADPQAGEAEAQPGPAREAGAEEVPLVAVVFGQRVLECGAEVKTQGAGE